MPHSTQDQDDDELINSILAENEEGNPLSGLGNFHERDLELGEKADDAEDFEDISDDDLADDEDEAALGTSTNLNGAAEVKLEEDDVDLFGDTDDLDALFDNTGEHPSSSGTLPDATSGPDSVRPSTEFSSIQQDLSFGTTTAEDISFPSQEPGATAGTSAPAEDEDDNDPEVLAQRKLFELSRQHQTERAARGFDTTEPPPPPETDAELFSIVWPQFEPHVPPRMGAILTSKKAYYPSKTPLKPPKPIQPTKANLELAPDQEKSFKLPGAATSSSATRFAEAEARGLTLTGEMETVEESSDDDMVDVTDDEVEDVGGVGWQELVALCQDWDIPDGASDSEDEDVVGKVFDSVDQLFFDEQGRPSNTHPNKKQKISHQQPDPFSLPVFTVTQRSFDNPERATRKLAKRVNLDMNDPNLLIDVLQQNQVAGRRRKFGTAFKRDAIGGLTRDLNKRYNISNDEAYELLKENHQSKIRSHLSNVTIEHSMPALRLQYPFYKVELSPREARHYHRQPLAVHPGYVYFSKPNVIKRKHREGKDIASLYFKTSDLSLGDNAQMLLLEYSEEHPAMLSDFGMNNRIINYYRKTDEQDTTRPKLPVGDPMVLLPQDKSPFSIFGNIDAGEVTPTIRNNMYRAPIFAHEAKPQDFLVVRSRCAVEGDSYFIRKIDNLHVVGQEFPLVEVPGTHSRKVTDASKRRLRMVSYRMYNKNKRLKNEMILKHLPGSDIPSNRSKMREFMDYDKDKGWLPKKEVPMPADSAGIRAMIKPEDIALLDAMQVGNRHLKDAGYNRDSGFDEDDEEEGDSQSLDHKLAPWYTTKNFLNACQGKAMLQLHGEGDPTGRGEAFNMIRTSMKGGFKEQGQSIEDRLKKENGHSYNVAKQQKAYNDTIRRIWEAQKASLSSNVQHEAEPDVDDGPETSGTRAPSRDQTPGMTPGKSRRDDESMFSSTSDMSQQNRAIIITRIRREKYTGREITEEEIERDPKVIREYMKRRRAVELSQKSIAELKATGDPEADKEAQRLIENELARVERNIDRRKAREKAKGINNAGSPDADGNTPDAEGSAPSKKNTTGTTQRKCANCGQVGHIKTNKKYCSVCDYMLTPISDLRGVASRGTILGKIKR